MRDVAIVSVAELTDPGRRDEAEVVQWVCQRARDAVGLKQSEIGFTCSGSCDFLTGRPFSFVTALDGVGLWPPASESHVEMDGAWALYEAWVRLQHGDVDLAIVYAFGEGTAGDLDDICVMQLDPYSLAPLWPDRTSLAALQANALMDRGRCTREELDVVAARRRGVSVDAVRASQPTTHPLRSLDAAVVADGAIAVVLAVGDRARTLTPRPAWIKGIAHAIDSHHPGTRDLTTAASASQAARAAHLAPDDIERWELSASFTHHEILLRDALGIPTAALVDPDGGVAEHDVPMVSGLAAIGRAATAVMDGSASSAVAHATSGPCLQQNLVCVLGAE